MFQQKCCKVPSGKLRNIIKNKETEKIEMKKTAHKICIKQANKLKSHRQRAFVKFVKHLFA